MELPTNSPAENTVVPTMKAPLILMEILAYDIEENKPKIKRMFDSIQKQLDKSKTNTNKVRLLWYVDNGEMTDQEKINWLIEQSNCVFYAFAPKDYNIPDNYIANIMIGPNMFDRALGVMRKENIKMKGKKRGEVEAKEEIFTEPAEIIE